MKSLRKAIGHGSKAFLSKESWFSVLIVCLATIPLPIITHFSSGYPAFHPFNKLIGPYSLEVACWISGILITLLWLFARARRDTWASFLLINILILEISCLFFANSTTGLGTLVSWPLEWMGKFCVTFPLLLLASYITILHLCILRDKSLLIAYVLTSSVTVGVFLPASFIARESGDPAFTSHAERLATQSLPLTGLSWFAWEIVLVIATWYITQGITDWIRKREEGLLGQVLPEPDRFSLDAQPPDTPSLPKTDSEIEDTESARFVPMSDGLDISNVGAKIPIINASMRVSVYLTLIISSIYWILISTGLPAPIALYTILSASAVVTIIYSFLVAISSYLRNVSSQRDKSSLFASFFSAIDFRVHAFFLLLNLALFVVTGVSNAYKVTFESRMARWSNSLRDYPVSRVTVEQLFPSFESTIQFTVVVERKETSVTGIPVLTISIPEDKQLPVWMDTYRISNAISAQIVTSPHYKHSLHAPLTKLIGDGSVVSRGVETGIESYFSGQPSRLDFPWTSFDVTDASTHLAEYWPNDPGKLNLPNRLDCQKQLQSLASTLASSNIKDDSLKRWGMRTLFSVVNALRSDGVLLAFFSTHPVNARWRVHAYRSFGTGAVADFEVSGSIKEARVYATVESVKESGGKVTVTGTLSCLCNATVETFSSKGLGTSLVDFEGVDMIIISPDLHVSGGFGPAGISAKFVNITSETRHFLDSYDHNLYPNSSEEACILKYVQQPDERFYGKSLFVLEEQSLHQSSE